MYFEALTLSVLWAAVNLKLLSFAMEFSWIFSSTPSRLWHVGCIKDSFLIKWVASAWGTSWSSQVEVLGTLPNFVALFLSKLVRLVAPLWGATFLICNSPCSHLVGEKWPCCTLVHPDWAAWDAGIPGRILIWFYQLEHQGLHNSNKQLMPCFPAATPRATSPMKRADWKRNEPEWYMKGLL